MKTYLSAAALMLAILCASVCHAKSPEGAIAAATDKAAAAKTDNTEKADAEDKFVPLFDGKTLKGWWPHTGVPTFHVGGKFEVIDGNIVAMQDPPGKGGFLATKDRYGDFVIRLEVKMDYPSDSGVFLRMGEDGKSHQVTLDNRPDGDFGAIYLPWTQSSVLKSPEGIKSFKQKEWNDVQIKIEGEPARIQFWLNGTKVTDFQHTAETTKGVPRAGYIGLQIHPTVTTHVNYKEGNQVCYRNIRIESLDKEKLGIGEKAKESESAKK